MLLEFTAKNYKSFAGEFCFSLTPAPKQKGLDYSIMSEKIGSRTYKGLCSAVIYGPNAAGKTNIIGAMETFKAIVLRGNINNSEMHSPNAAAYSLELVPNCNTPGVPTSFSIKFTHDDMVVDYSLTVDLGPFMSRSYERKILTESLTVNEKICYERNTDLKVFYSDTQKTNSRDKRTVSLIETLAEQSLSDTELFLNNGFKSIYSQKIANTILDWFSKKFIVIYRSNGLKFVQRLAEPLQNALYLDKTIKEAAKVFGVTANEFGYRTAAKEADSDDEELYSVIGGNLIPAELFESYGTIRFINEFPLVIYALLNGGTLIIDEFDASIHPMALMNIINIFHNDEINKKHAQLVFNTHNPIFLDSALLRRDEIKFVERDEKTGISEHYSLSDFKTADGVRKGEDYMNNYFISRYGAIKDIDFTPILEKMISHDGDVSNE